MINLKKFIDTFKTKRSLEEKEQLALDSKLYKAIIREDYKQLKQLIKSGANVNAPQFIDMYNQTIRKMSPLHFALIQQDIKAVETLIKHGADVNLINPKHPLLCVSTPSIADILLKAGSDINIANQDPIAPLIHYVMDMENVDLLKFYLEHNADPNFPDSLGDTPFHFAVRTPKIARDFPMQKQMLELLLTHGANPEKPNQLGFAYFFTSPRLHTWLEPILEAHHLNKTLAQIKPIKSTNKQKL